jgi:hypothetical protein
MYRDWRVVEGIHNIKRTKCTVAAMKDRCEHTPETRKVYREVDLAKKRALARVDRQIAEQEARCTALGLVLHSNRGDRLHATYAQAHKILDDDCRGWIPAADYS